MRRSIFASLFLAVFAAATFAHAGQRVTIWSQSYNQQTDGEIDALVAEYSAANPGVEVLYDRRSTDEHKVALRVAATGRTGPDIYMMWGGLGLGGEFVNADFSAPLNEYYEQYKWDDILIPSSLSDTRRYRGDERHGVPFVIRAQALYYNKRLFEKAGIAKLPETYDELIAVCEQLKAAGIAPITFGGSVNWFLMRLVDVLLEKNCGAEEHDKLIGMELDWSTHPGVLKTFEELKHWSDSYILKPFMGIGADQSRTLFFQNRAAMILEGDGFIPSIQESANIDDFDFFPFPTGTDRLYFFSEMWYVNKNSQVKDEAAKFLDYFISKPSQDRLLGKLGTVSVNTASTPSPDALPIILKWHNHFKSSASTFPNGDQGFPLNMTMEYFRVINAVASGNMLPGAAGAAMQTFISQNKK